MTRTIYQDRPIGRIPIPARLPWRAKPQTALMRKRDK